MQCCRAKLEGAEHFVHHTHFAGGQSRRMGRHKTPAARRFLSQLKADCTEFNDLPFRYCTEQLQIFAENDAELLFVHIREPEEIERFRQAAGVNCKTILVRRPTLEQARGQLGNRSDDGVAAYAYDAEFLNDGSLEELPAKVHDFLQALIKR